MTNMTLAIPEENMSTHLRVMPMNILIRQMLIMKIQNSDTNRLLMCKTNQLLKLKR